MEHKNRSRGKNIYTLKACLGNGGFKWMEEDFGKF
jgi:hypothetical protein